MRRNGTPSSPGLSRPSPAPGLPARLPQPHPARRHPAPPPTAAPVRSALLIDLRVPPEDEQGLAATPARLVTSPSVESRPAIGGTPSVAVQMGSSWSTSPPESLSTGVSESRGHPGDGASVPDEVGGGSDPPLRPVRPGSGWSEAWPEIRFYLGAFSLFFVSYVLVTGLLVGGAAVLFGLTPVAVTSGSMAPVIRTGDVVMFAATPEPILGPGTVVGYDETGTGRAITHRIVRANPDGTYVTQGDANPDPDPRFVLHEQIWGVGRLLIPYAGFPAAWVATGQAWKLGLLAVFLAGCGYASRWAVLEEYNPWSGVG